MALRYVPGYLRQPVLFRSFSTTGPRPRIPLHMLSALSQARETEHFTKRSGLGVTNHAPSLEAIKSSEVDPFAPSKPPRQQKQQHGISSPPPRASTPQSKTCLGLSKKEKPESTIATHSNIHHDNGPISSPNESQYRSSLVALLMRGRPMIQGTDKNVVETIQHILEGSKDEALPELVREQIAAARARDNDAARVRRKQDSSGNGSSSSKSYNMLKDDSTFFLLLAVLSMGAIFMATMAESAGRHTTRESEFEFDMASDLDRWAVETEAMIDEVLREELERYQQSMREELERSQRLMRKELEGLVGISDGRSWFGKLLWATDGD